MTLRLVVTLFVCASTTLSAAVAGQELDKLGAFQGHWRTTGEIKETRYSKAKIKSQDEMTCGWTSNHGFMICDQLIHAGGLINNELSIYTYNPAEHCFAFFGVARNDQQARTTKLTITGNLWTYWDEEDDGGKHVSFRTTNRFVSPDRVEWRSEYSEDGMHWVLMGEGADTRIR